MAIQCKTRIMARVVAFVAASVASLATPAQTDTTPSQFSVDITVDAAESLGL